MDTDTLLWHALDIRPFSNDDSGNTCEESTVNQQVDLFAQGQGASFESLLRYECDRQAVVLSFWKKQCIRSEAMRVFRRKE